MIKNTSLEKHKIAISFQQLLILIVIENFFSVRHESESYYSYDQQSVNE